MTVFNSASMRTRAPGIDIARALAVIGVVATHTVAGMLNSGIIDQSYPAYSWMQNVGMLRLPALALLMGLFIPGGIDKRGLSRYLRVRLTSLGYLYVIWSLIQGSVAVIFASFRNGSGGTWLGILSLATPEGQLWFLPYVMVSTTLLAFFRPWENWKRTLITLLFCLTVTLIMWGRQYNYVGVAGLSLLFFSALGAVIGLRGAIRILDQRRGVWCAIGTVSMVSFVFLLRSAPQHPVGGTSGTPPESLLASLFASITGCIALVAVAQILSWVPLANITFQLIGRRTLEIFVMHYSLYAGTRVLLMQVGIGDPLIHLVAGIGVGVLVPLFMAWLLPRIGFGWVFTPPRILLFEDDNRSRQLDGRSQGMQRAVNRQSSP